MLKSSFNFLGATIKSQKWSKNEALGSDYTFKDGLSKHYTVWPDKCILNSYIILSKQPRDTFYLETLCINDYFLMYICR